MLAILCATGNTGRTAQLECFVSTHYRSEIKSVKLNDLDDRLIITFKNNQNLSLKRTFGNLHMLTQTSNSLFIPEGHDLQSDRSFMGNFAQLKISPYPPGSQVDDSGRIPQTDADVTLVTSSEIITFSDRTQNLCKIKQ